MIVGRNMYQNKWLEEYHVWIFMFSNTNGIYLSKQMRPKNVLKTT